MKHPDLQYIDQTLIVKVSIVLTDIEEMNLIAYFK